MRILREGSSDDSRYLSPGRFHSALRRWSSVFSVQRSAFSVQRSAFSVQRSAFSVQRSAFSLQPSAFSSAGLLYSIEVPAFHSEPLTYHVPRTPLVTSHRSPNTSASRTNRQVCRSANEQLATRLWQRYPDLKLGESIRAALRRLQSRRCVHRRCLLPGPRGPHLRPVLLSPTNPSLPCRAAFSYSSDRVRAMISPIVWPFRSANLFSDGDAVRRSRHRIPGPKSGSSFRQPE